MNAPQRTRGARPGPSNNLPTQLVSLALLSVALPVMVTGVLTFFFLTYHLDVIETNFVRSREAITNDIARTDLMAKASNTALQIDTFLLERIMEASAWASAGVVIDAALAAHGRHVAEGLTTAPADAVENRFRVRKSLDVSPEANAYLRNQVAVSPYFAEIFFTDRNGFNVALTNPTSDFVQSDEAWWQNAWNQGISVGKVEYDESAGVWSIDISVRIDEPGTKVSIGVMKAVLAIEPVQRIADGIAQITPGGRVQVATGGGALIAETSSGHARERIMNPEINLYEGGEPSVRAAFGSEHEGFVVDQDWLTSYARSGGHDTYASIDGRFSGFDWVIILQKPMVGIYESLSALRAIDDALRDWRQALAVAIGAMVLLSAIFAVALALGAARRYAASLQAIRELAENTAKGKNVVPPVIEHPEEIARVNDAVRHLGQVFTKVLKRSQSRQ